MNELENRMVIDSEWKRIDPQGARIQLIGPGYKEIGTEIFVPEEDAYDYAMERISTDEDLKKEFKDSVVEWFYSGNWVKED